MMMALLPTGIETLLGRSPDSRPGVMPNGEPETYPEKAHDGVTESVVIRTKVRITAGAGKLTMDLDISSVDTIKDEATGAEVGRLEGNAHGHIDINACPDQDGLSEGSYELSLQEELVRPGSAGAGDARVIDAPFKLIDGDDAHLQRIEGTFAITEHAHGPGGAGTGSGGPFDWSVTATVPDVIQRNGSGAPGEPSVQSNGDPTASQVAKAIGGRLTAENYLKVLGPRDGAVLALGQVHRPHPQRRHPHGQAEGEDRPDGQVGGQVRWPGDPEADRRHVQRRRFARPGRDAGR